MWMWKSGKQNLILIFFNLHATRSHLSWDFAYFLWIFSYIFYLGRLENSALYSPWKLFYVVQVELSPCAFSEHRWEVEVGLNGVSKMMSYCSPITSWWINWWIVERYQVYDFLMMPFLLTDMSSFSLSLMNVRSNRSLYHTSPQVQGAQDIDIHWHVQ